MEHVFSRNILLLKYRKITKTLNEEKTIAKEIVIMKSELMSRYPLLDEIVVVDSGSADMTREIARNVDQASAGTNEVSKNIGDISGGIQETSAMSKEVLTASDALSNQSTILDQELTSFMDEVRKII